MKLTTELVKKHRIHVNLTVEVLSDADMPKELSADCEELGRQVTEVAQVALEAYLDQMGLRQTSARTNITTPEGSTGWHPTPSRKGNQA